VIIGTISFIAGRPTMQYTQRLQGAVTAIHAALWSVSNMFNSDHKSGQFEMHGCCYAYNAVQESHAIAGRTAKLWALWQTFVVGQIAVNFDTYQNIQQIYNNTKQYETQ